MRHMSTIMNKYEQLYSHYCTIGSFHHVLYHNQLTNQYRLLKNNYFLHKNLSRINLFL